MHIGIVKSIKALIKSRLKDLDDLEISWFGGEPLLAKEIVLDISQYTFQQCMQYPGLKYHANITTNGYFLDAATISRLKSVGISLFQVTLDGSQALHNKTRKRSDGADTFDIIWKNLIYIKDSSIEVKIILRVHFSPQTFSRLTPLINQINMELGTDERFSVFLKAIKRLGGENDGHIKIFTHNAEKKIKKILESQLATPQQIYNITDDIKHYICYASMPNSFVIRSDGTIGKSTVALNNPKNHIGELKKNGAINLKRSKFDFWIRGFSSLDWNVLACPLGSLKHDYYKAVKE